jgi:hypothetical protein
LKFKVKDKGPILGLKASYEGVKTTRNYNMSYYAPLSGGSVHTPGVMFGQVVCPNILKCQSLARYACEYMTFSIVSSFWKFPPPRQSI